MKTNIRKLLLKIKDAIIWSAIAKDKGILPGINW